MTDAETLRKHAEAAALWLMKNTDVSVTRSATSWGIWRLSNHIGRVDYFTNTELIQLAKGKGWTPNA